jgi:hypothetical protein
MIEIDDFFARELARSLDQPIRPLEVDPWIASSTFQKAIRRGDSLAAQQAATTLLLERSSAFWRRLTIVAFEDVGIGSVSTVQTAVLVATDQKKRLAIADDRTVVANLVRLLGNVAKNRATEHLLTAANFHPDLSQLSSGTINIGIELGKLSDRDVSKYFCALAVSRAAKRGALGSELFIPYARAGVPDEVIASAELAFRATKDPIVLMLPLVWLLCKGQGTAKPLATPRSLKMDGVPSYALDKHTLSGRQAIRTFVRNCNDARACLSAHVQSADFAKAAYMAAFYADGAPLALKFSWEGSEELERLAIEADLIKSGVSRSGVGAVLEVFQTNLGLLNKLRAHVFYKKRGYVDVATALLREEGDQ